MMPKEILHRMLVSRALVPILAEYTFNVLKVFERSDMFVASEAYWYGQKVSETKRSATLDVML